MNIRWDAMYREYDDEFERFEDDFEDNMDEFVCPMMRQGPFNQFTPPFGPGFQGPPSGPPPSFVPQQAGPSGIGVQAVDPGAIRRCTFRFVFIWPERGRGFWAFLVFVGRRSVAGWRWNGRRWVYFGMDLRRIRSFQCY